jgi:peptidylprolyl isomerase
MRSNIDILRMLKHSHKKGLDMIRRVMLLAAMIFSAVCAAPVIATAQGNPDPQNTLVIDLKDGQVLIALRPDLAPQHVERIKTLAKQGFYDGLVFHRVIEGFMAQTGDPKGTGAGGSTLPNLPAEFSKEPFERGTLGMARTSDPNSANSQFFITFEDAPHLNGQYTVFGKVISGMQFVDKIKRGAPGSGAVTAPDKMVKVHLLADAK